MNCLLNSSNFGKLVSYLDIDEFLNYLFYVVKMLLWVYIILVKIICLYMCL